MGRDYKKQLFWKELQKGRMEIAKMLGGRNLERESIRGLCTRNETIHDPGIATIFRP